MDAGPPDPERLFLLVHPNVTRTDHRDETDDQVGYLSDDLTLAAQAKRLLNMLMTETAHGRYPYAGIPWYSTTFGRDGLLTALQMLWIDPRVARGVLKRLAAYQAEADDPEFGSTEPPVDLDCAAPAAPAYFNTRKTTIYGGSNEIQRNILAKAVLGF